MPVAAEWRASASAVSRISRSPGRNTRMSPGPTRRSSVDGVGDGGELVAVGIGVGVVGVHDGPVADVDRVGAAGDLDDRRARRSASEKRSGSMVAEVMTTLRSGRRGSSWAR